MTEIEELKAQIKVLEKKLSFLEELEKTKSPCEKAFKEFYGAYPKSKTLTDLIYRWWDDVFTTHSDWEVSTSIEDLVDQIELWLPKEHDTNSYKWNQCIRTIREKLR